MTSLGTRPPASFRPFRRASLRPSLIGELVVIVLGYIGYSMARVAVRGDQTTALINGRAIYRLEEKLHIDPERWLNTALDAHVNLATFAGYYYAICHFVVTPAVLIWLYWRHVDQYRSARTILIGTTLPALALFWLFPVAPPRFALSTVSDTLADFHILELAAPRSGTSVANLNAAMPSLHVAWAMWCALVIWRVYQASHPRLALLAYAYPVATTLVVISTANHYLLDAVVGVALVLFCATVDQTMRLPDITNRPLPERPEPPSDESRGQDALAR